MTTPVFRRLIARGALVRFTPAMWAQLLTELRRRGAGRRESGAFLLAPRAADGRTITALAYYDDLEPTALNGGVALTANAYTRLWARCASDDVRVVGDVHTHPGRGVCQSDIDEANPMVSRRGHVALIVPAFAQGAVSPNAVGVHRYRGAEWDAWYGRDAAKRLYVGRWA